MTLFTGLSAFPLTPFSQDAPDEGAYVRLIERLVKAGVDSITALGSTGSGAYVTPSERSRITRLTRQHAAQVPVIVGVSALRTSQVLAHVDDAEAAGASGLLVAPVSYQVLTDDDVFELYHAVTEHSDLPVIVYDNPGTTHFTFSNALYARIAALPGIASIKIPGVPRDPATASDHVAAIRSAIPAHVTIGVSGDAFAATGLNAGCDAWYSAIGGTFPAPAVAITQHARAGRGELAVAESERLAPLWDLFTEFSGSLRVIAAAAEHLDLAPARCLPLPLQGLTSEQRARVAAAVDSLALT